MPATKDIKTLVGKKFRFVVSSAEEAVKIIREQLGEQAKVLEVNQIGGKGLARFLSSPKLEIIATIPAPVPLPPPPEEKKALPEEKKTEVSEKIGALPENEIKEEIKITKPKPEAEKITDNSYRSAVQKAKQTIHPNNTEKTLLNVLEKMGFDLTLMNNLKSSQHWENIKTKSLSHALLDISEWVREEYHKIPVKSLGMKNAFIGTPGSGKTTALCKAISKEVFLDEKRVQVMKLESDTPNPDDGLRVFCDVLGVSLLRDKVDADWLNEKERLYIDLPGVTLLEKYEIHELNERLNALNVDTRILIVNSLYENDQIKSSFLLGKELNCTHVAFSHIDELGNFSKLWPHILRGGLVPLFLSHGQNVTGDRADNVLEYLLNKTFNSF